MANGRLSDVFGPFVRDLRTNVHVLHGLTHPRICPIEAFECELVCNLLPLRWVHFCYFLSLLIE